LLSLARCASGAPTGLNTIPTTDLVPLHNWIGQIQNGNSGFDVPAFYSAPHLVWESQFALTSQMEAGIDYLQLGPDNRNVVVANIKGQIFAEDYARPNVAIGVMNIASRRVASTYLALSKTLNYDEEQRERFRAHHRRNRKLLGRRIHAGLFVDGEGTVEPFVGTDLQLNDSAVFQADWINGTGNALTAGLAYVLKDNRTVLNPALLLSNDKHRPGFFLNVSHQFNL
jgi:hypothetical protein